MCLLRRKDKGLAPDIQADKPVSRVQPKPLFAQALDHSLRNSQALRPWAVSLGGACRPISRS